MQVEFDGVIEQSCTTHLFPLIPPSNTPIRQEKLMVIRSSQVLNRLSLEQMARIMLLSALLVTGYAVGAIACEPVSTLLDPPQEFEQSENLQPNLQSVNELPARVARRARRFAAQDLNRPVGSLSVLRYSRETWSDGCFGLGGAAELCLFALVEGWAVEVQDGDQTWVYRTDLAATHFRRVPMPQR
jgi:hypothetical protein